MQLSQSVLATYATIQAELGSSFSLDTLCRYVEQRRQKPLVFHEETLTARIYGACIPLADVDLVLTRVGLDSVLQLATQLHELAHLLLNHMVLLTVDEGTASYLEYRTGNVVADRLMRQFDRTAPHEHDAEMLAMFLHRCIVAHDQDAPSYAQQLYGHRS
jgi:hypothetical protein